MSDSRVILVSGGSRGLGLAIVEHFLRLGDCVATMSRGSTDDIDRLCQDKTTSKRFWHDRVDATDAQGLRGFVESVKQRFGRIDVLINNAGTANDGVLALMDEAVIDQMLSVNLRASLLLAKEVSRLMLDQGAGHIINVASIIAQSGFSGLSVYGATKAGQVGMTRSLARELGPRNIRVNAIAPGYLETEMSAALTDEQRNRIVRRTPLGRLGSVNDVVPCIEFLLSPGGQFITGQVITIDGGASI